VPIRNRTTLIYILLFVAIIAFLVINFNQSSWSQKNMTFTELVENIKAGSVISITENEDRLTVEYYKEEKNQETGKVEKVKESITSTKDTSSSLVEQLSAFGVTPEQIGKIVLTFKSQNAWLGIFSMLSYILPFLVLAGVFWFIFRQAQGSNNAAMSFGKSRARMFTGDQPQTTFQDVAGVDEAKEELREVVEFLREPEKFISLGARIPKGVLLVGPPGTGKTLLAKAVSGEAGVPFFSISGSEFVEMFVGVGASRVRDLFEQAKRHSPCIVFVDEIDAVGRQRGAGLGGSHDEREQTLNQMLVEMDGFDTDTNVIIMAATNRPDILDPALLRPGRFDRRVVLDRPDMRGREMILKVHVKGKPLDPNINLTTLARSTPGFVGADLENLVNEAAILAARRNKKVIGQSELEEAIERVIAGPERKSRLISEEEKRIVAYHEAGHAVVINSLPEADPVIKVSIIARGMAGGYTLAMPEEDRILMSRRKLMAEMTGLLGGRAAEELVFDDITSGASNDLERVTRLARTMVTRLGMSDKLGTMVYGQKEELIFLGREISEQRDYSEAVAEEIDSEVRLIVAEAYRKAFEVLTTYREQLEAVAKRLLEVETITREELETLFPPPIPKISGTPLPTAV
jgi:cell division protease FtsH